MLISELLIFYPSVVLLARKLFKPIKKANVDEFYLSSSEISYLVSLLLVLLNPTIILIDHGHFQYNAISIGLMQLAVYFLISKAKTNTFSLIFGSYFFCLALNYKQMELYHALPFFFYLLAICVHSPRFFLDGFAFFLFFFM